GRAGPRGGARGAGGWLPPRRRARRGLGVRGAESRPGRLEGDPAPAGSDARGCGRRGGRGTPRGVGGPTRGERRGGGPRPPRPGSSPYRDALVALHVRDVEAQGGARLPSEALVYVFGMRDDAW